jgi:hypothetical protein
LRHREIGSRLAQRAALRDRSDEPELAQLEPRSERAPGSTGSRHRLSAFECDN